MKNVPEMAQKLDVSAVTDSRVRTIKVKGWGVLHLWHRLPHQKHNFASDSEETRSGGRDSDLEQITHGRWSGADDNYQSFIPSFLGSSPFERRAEAIRNKY